MKTTDGRRGFRDITHQTYPADELVAQFGSSARIAGESSAIGDYPDSMDKPGSSYIWIGEAHHLDREEVAQLIRALSIWLNTGRLPMLDG